MIVWVRVDLKKRTVVVISMQTIIIMESFDSPVFKPFTVKLILNINNPTPTLYTTYLGSQWVALHILTAFVATSFKSWKWAIPRAATLITAPLDGDSSLFATDLAAPWGSLRNSGSHTTYNMIITEHTAYQTFKKNAGVYAAKRRDMMSAKLGQGMRMALRLYTCWMNKKRFHWGRGKWTWISQQAVKQIVDPGQEHYVVFLGKTHTFTVPLSSQVYK